MKPRSKPKKPHTITFGGPKALSPQSEIRKCLADSGPEYHTEPKTLARQIECDLLHKTTIQGDRDFEEFRQDPSSYIRSMYSQYFCAYVATEWCERPEADWRVGAILGANEEEILKDCDLFFKNGGELDGNVGTSLEGIWFLKTFYYRTPFLCLLNRSQPDTPSDRICFKLKMKSEGIVEFLSRICSNQHGDVPSLRGFLFMGLRRMATCGTPVLVYDDQGWGGGHCIEVLGWDRESGNIVYQDPWPECSLLCDGENSLGISAQRYDATYLCDEQEVHLWQIDRDGLTRAIYAALIPVRPSFVDLLYFPGGIMPFPGG